MTNTYFDSTKYIPVTPLSLARAEAITAAFSAVEVGFNQLPSATSLQNDTVSYADDTGVAGAYVVTLQIVPTAYSDGLPIVFKALNANTGPSTLNANGLGVKQMTRCDGTALQSGDILAGMICDCRCDGTHIQLLNPGGALTVINASATSATAAAVSATSAATSAATATSAAVTASAASTAAIASAAAAAASALSLTSTQLAGVGFTTTQVASMTSTQLGALAFTTTTIAVMTPTQIGGLTTTNIASLVSTQIGGLNTTAVSILTQTQVGGLTPANVAGLTTTQLSTLSGLTFSSTQIVGMFQQTQIPVLSTTQVAGLSTVPITPFQMSGNAVAATGNVNAQQVTVSGNTTIPGTQFVVTCMGENFISNPTLMVNGVQLPITARGGGPGWEGMYVLNYQAQFMLTQNNTWELLNPSGLSPDDAAARIYSA